MGFSFYLWPQEWFWVKIFYVWLSLGILINSVTLLGSVGFLGTLYLVTFAFGIDIFGRPPWQKNLPDIEGE